MSTLPAAMQIASMGITTMIELDKCRRQRDELLEALLIALPFVEDACDDATYNTDKVKERLATIKAAIAKTST